MPVTASTVATVASGPPAAIAALILFVPPVERFTHESRGMPKTVARCASGLIPRMWIESERPRFICSPGRASDPSSSTKIGSLPSRVGV